VAVTAGGEALGGTVGWGSNDEISLANSMICATEREERRVDTYSIISLFSGIGGLDLGVASVIPSRTICYVERDIACARVLAARASEGLLDEAPIYSDIRTFPTELFAGRVDGIIGGFPCQPFSLAGKQKGSEDERNMWPDTIRVIREIRPRFAFLENVSALTSDRYFGTILADLAKAGYDAEWGCFTASEVGAPHKRERVFILAYTDHSGDSTCGCRTNDHGAQENEGRLRQPQPEPTGRGSELAYTKRERTQVSPGGRHATEQGNGSSLKKSYAGLPQFPPGPKSQEWEWIVEHYPELSPALCNVHETERQVRELDDAWARQNRVAALMMLGNAVLPQQAARALEDLWQRACRTG